MSVNLESVSVLQFPEAHGLQECRMPAHPREPRHIYLMVIKDRRAHMWSIGSARGMALKVPPAIWTVDKHGMLSILTCPPQPMQGLDQYTTKTSHTKMRIPELQLRHELRCRVSQAQEKREGYLSWALTVRYLAVSSVMS